jgi:hypothetical protein
LLKSTSVALRLATLFAVGALGACADALPIGPRTQAVTVSTAVNGTTHGRPSESLVSPFVVSLRLDSDVRIGEPFEVQGSARAVLPGVSGTLSLFMLDMHAIARDAGTLGTARIIPPDARSARLVQLESETAARSTFTIIEPGLYKFLATISVDDDSEPGVRRAVGRKIQEVSSAELWLVVDSASSRIVSDSEVSGEGFVRYFSSKRLSSAPEARSTSGVAASSVSSCGGYEGYVLYINSDDPQNLQVLQLGRVQVSGAFVSKSNPGITTPYTTFADADGRFVLPPHPGTSFSGVGRLANADVRVGEGTSGIAYEFAISVANPCEGVGGHVVPLSRTGKVWATMSLVAERARLGFQRTRGTDLRVEITGSSGAAYTPSADRVRIGTGSVWGQVGTFNMGHEYGHAYHHYALGGVPLPSTCLSSHFLSGAYTLRCAYIEGIANFFGALLLHDVLSVPILEDVFERSDHAWFISQEGLALGYWCHAQTTAGLCPLDRHTTDGARSETAVARVLYDLADDAQTQNYLPGVDDDPFELPWNWIGDIVATCEVQETGGWRRADGIDDLIYCFEGTLGNYHATGFFPSRTVPPIAWRSQAASAPPGFSQRNFRSLWQTLLFPHGLPQPMLIAPPPEDSPDPTLYTASIVGSVTVSPGSTCSWSVSTTLPGTLHYEWRVDGVIAGADSSALQLTAANVGFSLDVLVTNTSGQAAAGSLPVAVQQGALQCLDY